MMRNPLRRRATDLDFQERGQLRVGFAAFHTTNVTLSHILCDLAARPEYLDLLPAKLGAVAAAAAAAAAATPCSSGDNVDSFNGGSGGGGGSGSRRGVGNGNGDDDDDDDDDVVASAGASDRSCSG